MPTSLHILSRLPQPELLCIVVNVLAWAGKQNQAIFFFSIQNCQNIYHKLVWRYNFLCMLFAKKFWWP